MGDERESLARCTACGWAGLYAVRVDVRTAAESARAWTRANPCPACRAGEVRCALGRDEERDAIRQHLAAALGDVRALPTEDGAIAVVLGVGGTLPRAATVDPRALDAHPRLALERVIAQLRGETEARAPYR